MDDKTSELVEASTFIKSGKVKKIFQPEAEDEFLFLFTDQISVFDKIIPSLIQDKGAMINLGTVHWLEMASDKGICETTFIETPTPTTMSVRKADRVENPTTETKNYIIPLEVISRDYAEGSFLDRFKDGRLKPEDVGLTHAPKPGEKLPNPIVEFTTKFEAVDRPVSREEAMKIGGLTLEELEQIVEVTLKLDEEMARQVEARGLIREDGKKEFCHDEERVLKIIDTFGTGDEDRFIDKEAYELDGTRDSLSKEPVRQYYREIGYHEELMTARKADQPEPDIPPLTIEMIDTTRGLYNELHYRFTGRHIEEDLAKFGS